MSVNAAFSIVPIESGHRAWLRAFLLTHWGSEIMISKGQVLCIAEHAGFLAMQEGEPCGVITYQCEGAACEVTLLHSLQPGLGIGTALLNAAVEAARQAGSRRVWLITTNDNLNALGFYQKRGFTLVAVYPNAMEETRRLKPNIPLIGDNRIPLRDEIELEYPLSWQSKTLPQDKLLPVAFSGRIQRRFPVCTLLRALHRAALRQIMHYA